MKIELLTPDLYALGEGPLWDVEEQRFYWLDCHNDTIYRATADGKEVESLKAGETGAIVLNQTPFYAESGGQVGDTGVLSGEGVRFRVTDTQKKAGDLFVHLGTVEQGTLKLGTALQLDVDHARRSAIRAGRRWTAPSAGARPCWWRCSSASSPSSAAASTRATG